MDFLLGFYRTRGFWSCYIPNKLENFVSHRSAVTALQMFSDSSIFLSKNGRISTLQSYQLQFTSQLDTQNPGSFTVPPVKLPATSVTGERGKTDTRD